MANIYHLIILVSFPMWCCIECNYLGFNNPHHRSGSFLEVSPQRSELTFECSPDQIYCRSDSQCIALSDVCRNGKQCSDGSDEDPAICEFWKHDTYDCGDGDFYCSDYEECQTVTDFCQTSSCSSKKDRRICEIVVYGRLKMKTRKAEMTLTDELVDLLKKGVATTTALDPSTSLCPMFYTRVGDMCLSFFSPAKIPWAEARQFCLSLKGDLLSISDLSTYEKILQYMRMSKLTTDYWIGGRFDPDSNAWTWVSNTSMLLGSPYWATRYNTSCIVRSPPHTDPFSAPEEPLPGAPCYNYLQAPAQRKQGLCAAMTYDHYYYFTDEECQDNRSPLCFTTNSFESIHQKSGNTTQ